MGAAASCLRQGMDRVRVLAAHLCAGGTDSSESPVKRWRSGMLEYQQSIRKLQTEGQMPTMSIYELFLLQPDDVRLGDNTKLLDRLLTVAETDGSLKALELLPGPWKYATTREQRLLLLRRDQLATRNGLHTQLYAEYQRRYGDNGL